MTKNICFFVKGGHMNIILDKSKFENYKDMYKNIFNILVLPGTEFCDTVNFNYDSTILYSFLCKCENITFTFLNFDDELIENPKSYEDYEFSKIMNVFKDCKLYTNKTDITQI